MRKIVYLSIIIFLLVSCSDDKSTNLSKLDDVYAAVEDVRLELEETLEHSVPSINVYIQTPENSYFVSAASSEEDKLTESTNFRFASNTKTFTSTAVLNMYEDGWLDIYAVITDTIPVFCQSYVPDTPSWDIPYKNEITIEQLLQHTAGIYDLANDPMPGCNGMTYVDYNLMIDPDHQFSAEELVEQLVINELYSFVPGTDWSYSNTGYTILSEIIARVYSAHAGEDKTYSDYIYDKITGANTPVPIDSWFPCSSDDVSMQEPYSRGFVYYDSESEPEIVDELNMSANISEGNGYSSFVELNRFIRTLMRSENVLSASSVDLMQNDVSNMQENYSLGCMNKGTLGFGHDGCILGYSSLMLYDPVCDISLIVLIPMSNIESEEKFFAAFLAIYEAASRSREALGYPGQQRYPDSMNIWKERNLQQF